MSGLLYKEWMSFWRSRMLLILLLVFAAIPAMHGYAAAFVGMLPFMLIQMDEQAHWGRFALTLPYSDLQLVLPKYLLGWGLALAMALIASVSLFVSGAAFAEALTYGLFLLAAMSLLSAVICPVAFRFGTQRARFFFIFIVVVFGLAVAGYGGKLAAAMFDLPWLGGIFLLLTVPINALSVWLSQCWYRLGARA